MTMDEKIDKAVNLTMEIQKHNEYVFINDNGVIVIEWMEELIQTMEKIDIPQARQMLTSMKAEYHDLFSDFDAAMVVLKEGLVKENAFSIYVYLTQFDLAYRNKKVNIMKEALDGITAIVVNERYFSNTMYIRKARFFSSIGDKKRAEAELNQIRNTPENTREKFRNELLITGTGF